MDIVCRWELIGPHCVRCCPQSGPSLLPFCSMTLWFLTPPNRSSPVHLSCVPGNGQQPRLDLATARPWLDHSPRSRSSYTSRWRRFSVASNQVCRRTCLPRSCRNSLLRMNRRDSASIRRSGQCHSLSVYRAPPPKRLTDTAILQLPCLRSSPVAPRRRDQRVQVQQRPDLCLRSRPHTEILRPCPTHLHQGRPVLRQPPRQSRHQGRAGNMGPRHRQSRRWRSLR